MSELVEYELPVTLTMTIYIELSEDDLENGKWSKKADKEITRIIAEHNIPEFLTDNIEYHGSDLECLE